MLLPTLATAQEVPAPLPISPVLPGVGGHDQAVPNFVPTTGKSLQTTRMGSKPEAEARPPFSVWNDEGHLREFGLRTYDPERCGTLPRQIDPQA